MILEMEPLANAKRRRELAENIERQFRRAVLAQQAHGKMPIIGRAFGFAMAGCGRPGAREVIKTVPMNARGFSAQEFSRASQAPGLHFFGPEARDAHLRDPDRERGNGPDLVELGRPIADLPQIPVKRESVYGEHVDLVEDALGAEVDDEARIDWRDTAENALDARCFGGDRLARKMRHLGKS